MKIRIWLSILAHYMPFKMKVKAMLYPDATGFVIFTHNIFLQKKTRAIEYGTLKYSIYNVLYSFDFAP